jgi:hypothetical protein
MAGAITTKNIKDASGVSLAMRVWDESGSGAGPFAFMPQLPGTEYETVAASQTGQVLGASGAAGDLIVGVLVIPATTSPGAISILDSATSITVFAGGASSVSNLVPFFVPLGIRSVSGAWSLTSGANVSALVVGDFT